MNKKWFALYTKPRAEFKAEEQITTMGIENYLPTVTKFKQWSDRKKKVKEPLFSGYIFIRANEKERLISLEQNAVVRSITFEGKPAVIPDWQIDSLKTLMENNPEVFISNQLHTGQVVKVVDGPFRDVEGVIINVSRDERNLAISIDMLNRSVIVRLTSTNVVKKVK